VCKNKNFLKIYSISKQLILFFVKILKLSIKMNLFIHRIYTWYEANKRDLPWRQTSDPYKIWISEIILQQTQVIQVLGYYQKFINQFPTVYYLAESSENKVLKLWQGLGYYSRARNLYYSSKIIVNKFNGVFPNDYKSIIELKGIGEYTASAIASIAFNQPYAAVDGNIFRFLSRYFKISTPINSTPGKKEFHNIAQEILNTKDPGMHNQALMEFGALQCTPVNPNCNLCPVNDTCLAYNNKLVPQLPVKIKKEKQKNRYFYYFILEESNSIYLQQRKANDIWEKLYEFPLIETITDNSPEEIFNSSEFKNLTKEFVFEVQNISSKVIHNLSHQKIHTRFIYIHIIEKNKFTLPFIKTNKKDIPKFTVSKLIENYLMIMGLIS
jgi:A/G-specific adenine glycosylase